MCNPTTLLGSDSVHKVPAAMDPNTTIEELLDASSSMWSVSHERKVCMCIPTIAARQWHGKCVAMTMKNF
ncbi:hypothetical protein B7P43_G03994 [Cryptotermes secundus]|uniref:Uncharacterized protein n=1 Tax=Cryptotermes secundus TaxID=105785 RepID=A0A2J7RCA7_9NEOP|nr:hypothetical protein B7P43_G03994 [Cryptotermes secundus]